jgi:Ca2+-binding EF-hand superfamily protein
MIATTIKPASLNSAAEFKPCDSSFFDRFMTNSISLFAAALLILVAAPANADDASRNKEIQERFAKCDVNRDGKLTLTEAKGFMPRVYDHFSRIDRQNQGFVTVTEIEAMAAR